MQVNTLVLSAVLAACSASGCAQAGVLADPVAERSSATTITLHWKDADPVDVYIADEADAVIEKATLISRADADGEHVANVEATKRPYFFLRDRAAGNIVRVAERAIPLERGSNFRDVGGYPAAGGKHVKWGLIFRSGASPLLTEGDLEQIRQLALKEMFDLRSAEERQLAPTRIAGVRYSAVGYSMASMRGDMKSSEGFGDIGAIYRRMPTVFAPQLREIFLSLQRGDVPLVYNCSAGQDRTGFATAMILAALGVAREKIYEDYHLSTTYRRPQYELPKIDVAANAGNDAAMLFAKYQNDPNHTQPKPLYTADQKPFLDFAFEDIEQRWGTVDNYLAKEIGLRSDAIGQLRRQYLE